MARPRRLASPGAVSHGTRRGTARQRLNADDADRSTFLAVLEVVGHWDHWLCPALCVMDTHDPLVLESPEANPSAGMRQLNGGLRSGSIAGTTASATCFKDCIRPSWSIGSTPPWNCAAMAC
jgi:hypothetical protein